MKVSKNSLILTAAFTGLLSGTAARVSAMPAAGPGTSLKASLAGQSVDSAGKKGDKHSCKGQNSCKGKGGCSSGNNGCKGQNSCKGKGGCATDGSKKKA